MRKEAKPLVLLFGLPSCDLEVALRSKLGHCVNDRVVQEAIEGTELVDRKRSVTLESEVGDGLAQVPVVMNDLVYRVAEPEQFAAMNGCGTPISESADASPPNGPEICSPPAASPSSSAPSVRVSWLRNIGMPSES